MTAYAAAIEPLMVLHDAMVRELASPEADIDKASDWYRERLEKLVMAR